MTPEEDAIKNAMKEALKEWLDEKYALLGKWTLWGVVLPAVVFTLGWFILTISGWKPPV